MVLNDGNSKVRGRDVSADFSKQKKINTRKSRQFLLDSEYKDDQEGSNFHKN